MTNKKTKEDWLNDIKHEAEFVDLKPYSHNIISIALRALYYGWGKEVANNAVVKFGLNKKGWSVLK